MSLTTMPTPAQVKVPCKARTMNARGLPVIVCNRKGKHDKHINFRANVAWTDEQTAARKRLEAGVS